VKLKYKDQELQQSIVILAAGMTVTELDLPDLEPSDAVVIRKVFVELYSDAITEPSGS